jgi:hypothetical protein
METIAFAFVMMVGAIAVFEGIRILFNALRQK